MSREFGYSFQMTTEEMDKIHESRREKIYKDETGTMLIHSKTTTNELTKSPFEVLEYGCNSEGYWTYDRMVLQMEDCIDCIHTLHSLHSQFDIVY